MSMRVSTDPKDPGYGRFVDLHTDGYSVQVFLNGDRVPGVITADEEEGYVLAHRYTPEGRLAIGADGESYVFERRRGSVEIRVKRDNDDRVLH